MITSIERQDEKHYIFRVPSASTKDVYKVDCYYITGDKTWEAICDCKGYMHRQDCRHIKEVKQYAKNNLSVSLQIPMRLVREDGGLKCALCGSYSFGLIPRNTSIPYKGESNRVFCMKCGKVYEWLGVE